MRSMLSLHLSLAAFRYTAPARTVSIDDAAGLGAKSPVPLKSVAVLMLPTADVRSTFL